MIDVFSLIDSIIFRREYVTMRNNPEKGGGSWPFYWP